MALTGNQVLLQIASELDEKGFKDLNKELKKVGVQAEKTGKDGAVALSPLESSAKKTARSWMEAAAKGAIFAATVKKVVTAANEQAVADAQLAVAIKNNTTEQSRHGLTISQLTEKYKKFAQQRQDATNIDDAATQQLMKTLLAMGTAPGELERVTVAFQDMAAGSDVSAETMARAWGKLQEAPEEALGALSRVGVKIQAEMLAGMSTEQQRIFILEKLESKFKGQAAIVGEAQGAYGEFTVQIEEAAESLGGALMPAVSAVLSPITAILKAFASLPGWATGAIAAIGGITAGIMALNGALTLTPVGIIVTAVAAIGGLIGFLDGLADSTKRYKEIAQELADLEQQSANADAFTKKTNSQLDSLSRLTNGTAAYKNALQQMLAMNPALINMGVTTASSYDAVQDAVRKLNAESAIRVKMQKVELLQERQKLEMAEAVRKMGTSGFEAALKKAKATGVEINSLVYDGGSFANSFLEGTGQYLKSGSKTSTAAAGGGSVETKAAYDLQALRISLIKDEFARRRAEQARYYADEQKKIDESGSSQADKEEAKKLLAQKNIKTLAEIEREEQQKTLEALGAGITDALDIGTSILKNDWKSAIGQTLNSVSPVLGGVFGSAVGFFGELFSSTTETALDRMQKRLDKISQAMKDAGDEEGLSLAEKIFGKDSSKYAEKAVKDAQGVVDAYLKANPLTSGLSDEAMLALRDQLAGAGGFFQSLGGGSHSLTHATKDGAQVTVEVAKRAFQQFVSAIKSKFGDNAPAVLAMLGIDVNDSSGYGGMAFVNLYQSIRGSGSKIATALADSAGAAAEALKLLDDAEVRNALAAYEEDLANIEHELKTGAKTEQESIEAQLEVYDGMLAQLELLDDTAEKEEAIRKLKEEQSALQQDLNDLQKDAATGLDKYLQGDRGAELQKLLDAKTKLENDIATGRVTGGTSSTVTQQQSINSAIVRLLKSMGASESDYLSYETANADLSSGYYGSSYASMTGHGYTPLVEQPNLMLSTIGSSAYRAAMAQAAVNQSAVNTSNTKNETNINIDGMNIQSTGTQAEQIRAAFKQIYGIDIVKGA